MLDWIIIFIIVLWIVLEIKMFCMLDDNALTRYQHVCDALNKQRDEAHVSYPKIDAAGVVHNFAWALDQMYRGKRVSRPGVDRVWIASTVNTNVPNTFIRYSARVRGGRGGGHPEWRGPWIPAVEDLVAEDWQTVEDTATEENQQ